MDFGSVLYTAQRNKESSKQPVSYYKTSFDPPKKEHREKKLSLNIQKFLARQEEEKRQKLEEDERKKQELIALRNKDKKSNKRIQSMLKRTKSANKSVIEDAVDNVNTAITAAGPLQPDEDDYGYVSKDASELYDRLLSRYAHETTHEAPKFSQSSTKSSVDISSTKDRVKAALQREEEEKLLPRKRKRKSKGEGEGGGDNDRQSDDEPSPEPAKPERSSGNHERSSGNQERSSGSQERSSGSQESSKKENKFRIPKKNAGPPPIDFQSLLKLAEQKQHEPIVIEKKVELDRPDRPMTEKEKQEYLREKARVLQRESPAAAAKLMETLKRKQESSSKEKTKPTKAASSSMSSTSSKDATKGAVDRGAKQQSDPADGRSSGDSASRSKADVRTATSSFEKPKSGVDSASKQLPGHPKSKEASSVAAKPTAVEPKSLPRLGELTKEQKLKLLQRSGLPPKVTKPPTETGMSSKSAKLPDRFRDMPSSAARKVESSKPPRAESTARQFPPPDVRRDPKRELPSNSQGVRQFPPTDLAPKKKLQPPMMKKRPVIESDEEYDSEMDDFIDDSEANFDISKQISQIFGYDRTKYSRYDDEDDECMESNFSQLQKEEFISTKYGILEDLADIRQTKLEKERKKKRFK